MFARYTTLFVISLAALSSAQLFGDSVRKGTPKCLVGTPQCCNKVVKASESRSATALLGLMGTILDVLDVQVGITCAGLDEDPDCLKGEIVCCLDNSHDGVVAVGCHAP